MCRVCTKPVPLLNSACCHRLWHQLLVRKLQLGKLTASTASPASGEERATSAFIGSSEREGVVAPRPRGAQGWVGTRRLTVGWGQEEPAEPAYLLPLLLLPTLSLSPSHSCAGSQIFLQNHSLASARFPSGGECPQECSISPHFFLLLLFASLALRTHCLTRGPRAPVIRAGSFHSPCQALGHSCP